MARCNHNWRDHDQRHWDGSVFQQCSKCLQTRTTSGWVPWVVGAIILGAAALIFW